MFIEDKGHGEVITEPLWKQHTRAAIAYIEKYGWCDGSDISVMNKSGDQGSRAREKGTKANCSWNAMWNLLKDTLNGAFSFYKVGHHGSVNATPRQTAAASKGEPLAILNAILPEASKARAEAIVSTHRANYPTIPCADLVAEIGKRVLNTRNYDATFKQAKVRTSDVSKFAEYEKESFAEPQPLRTDLKRMLGAECFVDVEIE
jgi:hypothetical protein